MAYSKPPLFKSPGLVALDSHDLIALPLNEAYGASTAVNAGTLGAAGNFTATSCVFGCPGGPAGRSCYVGTTANRLVSSNGVCEPSTAITVSIWVRFNTVRNNWMRLFGKMSHTGTNWTAPFIAILIYQAENTNALQSYITTTDVTTYMVPGAANNFALIPPCEWIHWAITYDSVNDRYFRWYQNGVEMFNRAVTGTIVYTDRGPWVIGDIPGQNVGADAWVCDARVCDIARSATYIRNMYETGMGFVLT